MNIHEQTVYRNLKTAIIAIVAISELVSLDTPFMDVMRMRAHPIPTCLENQWLTSFSSKSQNK